MVPPANPGLMGLPAMPVQNAEIAAMFDQAAELLEIQGENQFRVRAYRRAARVIEGLPQSVHSWLSAGRDLSELPGIGKDLAGKIANIVKTGRFALLDTLKKQLPGELGDMAALPGLGPKSAKLLYDKLEVRPSATSAGFSKPDACANSRASVQSLQRSFRRP